jgi:hypothetical protein
MVINSLSSGGARKMSQFDVATSGVLPGGFVDVSRDGFVSPVDALMVINFLNTDSAPEGEGEPAPLPGADEPEGESPADLGSGGAEAALAFTAPSDESEGVLQSQSSDEELCDVPLPLVVKSIVADVASHLASLAHSPSEFDPHEIKDLLADAVDDLFARLKCEWNFGCDFED